jgi:hypothetical protein
MRVIATEEAEQTVRAVEASGRGELVMVLGTGCCDSTAPFLYDQYYAGSDVVEVGSVAGVPVFAHTGLPGCTPATKPWSSTWTGTWRRTRSPWKPSTGGGSSCASPGRTETEQSKRNPRHHPTPA